MVKKIIFWSLMIGGVMFVVNSVRPGSVSTAWKRAQARFEKRISPEFELARIRDQIEQLTPDMNRNISKIAQAMVEVQTLGEQIDDLQVRLSKAKDDLALLTDAIEKGTTLVNIRGREVSVTQVRDKLRTCQTLERELANKRKIYEAKKEGVEAARQQLVEMRRQKEELEVLAAEYESQLKILALEKTKTKLQLLDDSRLADIKQSLERLRQKIEVERQTQLLAEEWKNDTLTEKKSVSSTDIVTEAREYLGTASPIDATKK